MWCKPRLARLAGKAVAKGATACFPRQTACTKRSAVQLHSAATKSTTAMQYRPSTVALDSTLDRSGKKSFSGRHTMYSTPSNPVPLCPPVMPMITLLSTYTG